MLFKAASNPLLFFEALRAIRQFNFYLDYPCSDAAIEVELAFREDNLTPEIYEK